MASRGCSVALSGLLVTHFHFRPREQPGPEAEQVRLDAGEDCAADGEAAAVDFAARVIWPIPRLYAHGRRPAVRPENADGAPLSWTLGADAARDLLAAECRRTEVLIGKLLGPGERGTNQHSPTGESSDVPKNDRHKFRLLAANESPERLRLAPASADRRKGQTEPSEGQEY